MRNNVFAWNRDAQVWGWFDIADERHWPRLMQTASAGARPLSLEDLNLTFENNLYCPGPNQGLFNWGTTWKRHREFRSLDEVRRELSLARNSAVADFHVRDYSSLDLRVRANTPAVTMGCYSAGSIPRVRLGIAD